MRLEVISLFYNKGGVRLNELRKGEITMEKNI